MDSKMLSPLPQVKERDPYIDILKGIGIMSIVVGHSAAITIPAIKFHSTIFVYGYHIMIFMFVLGFLFNKDKCVPPFNYIGKTIVSMGKLYFVYSVIFLLLHNRLLKWGFISNVPFEPDQIATKMINSLLFNTEESMLGAMWFVPMYVFAAIIFSLLFYIAEKNKFPMVFHVAFICITMTVGLMMHSGAQWYLYHIQTSVLALPVCYFGFFVKKYWNVLKKFVTWYGGIIAAIGLHFLVTTKHGGIELSANQIITPYLFYPATFLGIYYCLALAKIISTFKYSRKIFAYVGKNSFHIMALHFVCLKLVDVIYGLITNQPPEIYSKFPFAFDLWYIYYPVGIFLPLGIIELCKLVKKYTALGISKISQKALDKKKSL